MEKIAIELSELQSIYKESSEKGKEQIRKLLPDMDFYKSIMDRVKTVDDAYKIKGLQRITSIPGYPEKHMNALITTGELFIVAEVLNEGWVPDYDNKEERKWWPYFEKDKSGFGFSGSHYVDADALTRVGSRLVFKTKELSDYFGKQFIKEHNVVLMMK